MYPSRPMYIAKRPIHMAKEPYSYGKRALFIWQKRPTRTPERCHSWALLQEGDGGHIGLIHCALA